MMKPVQVLALLLFVGAIVDADDGPANADCTTHINGKFWYCLMRQHMRTMINKVTIYNNVLKVHYSVEKLPKSGGYFGGNEKLYFSSVFKVDNRKVPNNYADSLNGYFNEKVQKEMLPRTCSENNLTIDASSYFEKAQLASVSNYAKVHRLYRGSTFHYFNVVPIWKPFYDGNWQPRVEKSIIKLFTERGGTYKIFTGIYDQIPCDKKGLLLGWEGRIRMPIPRLIYKVVEPFPRESAKAPVLIVMVNDPRFKKGEIEANPELHLCPGKDICTKIYFDDKFTWFRYSTFYCDKGLSVPSDGFVKKGYTYACDINESIRNRIGLVAERFWNVIDNPTYF